MDRLCTQADENNKADLEKAGAHVLAPGCVPVLAGLAHQPVARVRRRALHNRRRDRRQLPLQVFSSKIEIVR